MLGQPLPLDEHAVSVSLPTWGDVVGYEEGHARVLRCMRIGYPRFKVHAAVELLCKAALARATSSHMSAALPGHTSFSWAAQGRAAGHTDFSLRGGCQCMVLPSLAVARRCRSFLQRGDGRTVLAVRALTELFDLADAAALAPGTEQLQAVLFLDDAGAKAKAFWQHTGEVVSSRQAEAFLRAVHIPLPDVSGGYCADGLRLSLSDSAHKSSYERDLAIVAARVAVAVAEPVSNVSVVVSGMAALFTALRLAIAFDRARAVAPRKLVVFGFPYIDTLKLVQRPELNPGGWLFFGEGDTADLDSLERSLVGGERVSAVFTEVPSNPLLRVPDLVRLTRLAERFDFLLVVDDTVASFCSADLLHGPAAADLLCTSLTKGFSGCGDVMAGSLVVNSCGRHCEALLALLPAMDLPRLFPLDASTLERNSRDFEARCRACSRNARALAEWLSGLGDGLVASVFYPGLADDSSQALLRREEGAPPDVGAGPGLGCLLSLVLAERVDASVFYDSLQLSKGPSLGNAFTLVCPYTLLAHYNELPWAASFGVAARLIRISVGLEPIQELQDKILSAIRLAGGGSVLLG